MGSHSASAISVNKNGFRCVAYNNDVRKHSNPPASSETRSTLS